MRNTLSLGTRRHFPLLAASGILGLALTLFALGSKTKADQSPAAKPQALPSATVMVAARRVRAGSVIAPADMHVQTISGSAPPGVVTAQDAALGRIASRNMKEGDLLLKDSLRDPQEVGIAARIPSGLRAFSIRVAEDDIVGGFLQSADRVDILATIPGSAFPGRDAQSHSDRSQAVLLLQNVLVLAVGENSATRGAIQAGARTVSLALPPGDLARLTLALRFGKVSLAIRRPDDSIISDKTIATLDDLIGRQDSPNPTPAPHAVKASHGIPFYLGDRVTVARQDSAP